LTPRILPWIQTIRNVADRAFCSGLVHVYVL
jgi:hypothetical protein